MPLNPFNPLIALGTRVPNTGGIINQFANQQNALSRLAQQDRQTAEDRQFNRQRVTQNDDLNRQLTQQQINAGNAKIAELGKQQSAKDAAIFSAQLAQLPDDQILPALIQHRAGLAERMRTDPTVNTVQTDQLMQLAQSGQFDKVRQDGARGANIAVRAGILKAPAAPKAPTTRERKAGNEIITEQFNQKTGEFDEVSRAPRRSAPVTNISVDARQATAETAFAKQFGKTNAENFFKRQDAARDAVASIESTAAARELLNDKAGIISGFGGDFIVGFGKALQTIGFNVNEDAIANSEAFVATRAKEVGRIIKLFGAGTGLSDADREFATKAAAGSISANESSIRRIMSINNKAARNVIKRFNVEARRVPKNLSTIPLIIEMPKTNTERPLNDAERAELEQLRAAIGG